MQENILLYHMVECDVVEESKQHQVNYAIL